MMKFLSLTILLGTAAFAQVEDDPNAAWQRILVLNRAVPNAARETEINRLTSLETEADTFWQRYADHPHVWDVKVLLLQARLDRDALEGKKTDLRMVEADVKEITGAQTAPPSLRTEAGYTLVALTATQIVESRDASRLPEFDARALEFVRQFPSSPEAMEVVRVRLDLYEQLDAGKLESLLKEYAAADNPRIAYEAKRRLAIRDLRKKPLDLKFTTVDGAEFNLEKWRGKVVLVDFWATWCGPCRMEIPNVVAAYKKLHDKGFEIVGISLDSSKDKLLAYTKEKEMPWPQYFDGLVWENKISRNFGIAGIPAAWLVDKKGFVRLTDARGDLEGEVSKLLAE